MPQAKRIKPKAKSNPKSNAKSKTSWLRAVPWGLLLVVLITGIILGKLFYGSQQADSGLGTGLKTLFEQQQAEQDEDTQAIQDLVAKSTEKEFDFYEVLPDIEKVMPDDLPDAAPERPRDDTDYYVQAASFRKNADAEKLRARLALKGFKSMTQSRTSEQRGTYYRVVLGPFPDKRKAKTVKNKLKRLGVNPIVTSIKKNK